MPNTWLRAGRCEFSAVLKEPLLGACVLISASWFYLSQSSGFFLLFSAVIVWNFLAHAGYAQTWKTQKANLDYPGRWGRQRALEESWRCRAPVVRPTCVALACRSVPPAFHTSAVVLGPPDVSFAHSEKYKYRCGFWVKFLPAQFSLFLCDLGQALFLGPISMAHKTRLCFRSAAHW